MSFEKPRNSLDINHIKYLPILDKCTFSAVHAEIAKNPQTKGILCRHVSPAPISWPMWIIPYWEEMHSVIAAANVWDRAFAWLSGRQNSCNKSLRTLSNAVFEALNSVEWDTVVCGCNDNIGVEDLAVFVTQMTLVLQQRSEEHT